MAEPFDSNGIIGPVRNSPKDIILMGNILKDMGISEFEPRVLNQMLEFSYRYLTQILDDAYLYSTHAKKKCVDSEDVKLAINLYQEKVLAAPPARDVILEVAKQRNSMPLPQIKSAAGLRLPPDRHSLTACNYRLKSHKKKVHSVSRITPGNLPSSAANKNTTIINMNKPTIPVLPKSGTNLSPAITKPVVSISKPVPTPIIKFSDGKAVTPASSLSPTINPTTASSVQQLLMPTIGTTATTASQILMPTIGATTSNQLLMPSIGATTSNQLLMPSIGVTTSAPQILMPTVGITSSSAPQIHMPTVTPTDIKLSAETMASKRDMEEDDDYDMEE